MLDLFLLIFFICPSKIRVLNYYIFYIHFTAEVIELLILFISLDNQINKNI